MTDDAVQAQANSKGAKGKTSDAEGNGYLITLPLLRHRISLVYIRNKIIATLVRLPIQFLIGISYYIVHGSYILRRSYNVSRTRIHIPSRQAGRTIKADIYAPSNILSSSSTKEQQKPLPVLINWHGSGFVLKCFGADGEMCAYLANKMQCYVIDADYRKAPEHPFPACVQDGEDICSYVFKHPQRFDQRRISVGGSSAGAYIALCMGVIFGNRLHAVTCIAPPADFRPESRPKLAPEPNHPRALPRRVTLWFDQCYLTSTTDRALPLVSPACASMTSDQPNAAFTCHAVYIAVGRGDTLHQDGANLIASLKRQGHKRAILRSVPGEGHGFEKALRDGQQRTKVLRVFDEMAAIVTDTFKYDEENDDVLKSSSATSPSAAVAAIKNTPATTESQD